jgi:hydrogenase nickel incorporation protein HypB
MTQQPRILDVRQKVLKKNDEQARHLRQQMQAAGCCAISLVSGPGSGKTELLKQTAQALVSEFRVAILVGDLRTENDAKRLAESGAFVRQIETGTVCHLEAAMIESHLDQWQLSELDFLLIENVGNLVCPSTFDLGEAYRIVAVSTAEGEDKPLKYPTIFNTSDHAVVTKMDLAGPLEFDGPAMRQNIDDVRPGMPVSEVSAKTGHGMSAWLDALKAVRQRKLDMTPEALA